MQNLCTSELYHDNWLRSFSRNSLQRFDRNMVRDVAHASNQWPSVNAEKAPVASLSGDVDEVIASCCFLDGDLIASMAVEEIMPQTSLNSRILQEINVNIRSADQPGSRIPLNFVGDVGVGNPKKISTSLHPQSLDKLPELRWQQDTPVQHDQKTSITCSDIMFLNFFPLHLGEVCKRQICKKSPKSTTPALRPYVPPGGLYGIRTPPEGDAQGEISELGTLQWGTWWMNLYD